MFSKTGNGFWQFLGGYRFFVLLISLWTSWGIIKSFFISQSHTGTSQDQKRKATQEQQNITNETKNHYHTNDDFKR